MIIKGTDKVTYYSVFSVRSKDNVVRNMDHKRKIKNNVKYRETETMNRQERITDEKVNLRNCMIIFNKF